MRVKSTRSLIPDNAKCIRGRAGAAYQLNVAIEGVEWGERRVTRTLAPINAHTTRPVISFFFKITYQNNSTITSPSHSH